MNDATDHTRWWETIPESVPMLTATPTHDWLERKAAEIHGDQRVQCRECKHLNRRTTKCDEFDYYQNMDIKRNCVRWVKP